MKIYLRKTLFNAGYFCILVAFLITVTTLTNTYPIVNTLTRWLRIFGYLCLVLKIIIDNAFNRKSFVLFLILSGIAFVPALITGTQLILTDILILVASYNQNVTKIFKTDLFIRIFFLILIIGMFKLELIPQVIDYRNWILPRFSLGFGHPNRLSLHILVICMYMYYLYHDKKIVLYITYTVCLFFVLTVTDGRTSAIGIALLFILTLIDGKKAGNNVNKIAFKSAHWILAIVVIMSLMLPLLYIFNVIPHLSTTNTLYSRIVLAANGFQEYGVSLFGQNIESIGTLEAQRLGIRSNGIDNAYVFVLINYGLFAFIVLYAILSYTIDGIKIQKDTYAMKCFIIILIIASIEAQLVYIESNLFIIFAVVFFQNNIRHRYRRKVYNVEKS